MLEAVLKHQKGTSQLFFGKALLSGGQIAQACVGLAHDVVIISDSIVAPLYAQSLLDQLQAIGQQTHLLVFESGEINKNRKTKMLLEDQMLSLGCTRDTLIIAVGGGVVTDLAGFIAATFCRGITSIYVPTTLLGMVDASIGGKTGVNTSHGKNLIGQFYQPQSVWCDVKTLTTLGNDGLNDGWAETIKHALIKDLSLFNWIERLFHNEISDDFNWAQLVLKSCQIKCDIVMMDECESQGLRQWLNFGHTVAHAIERALNYSISHGQAVLAGMWVESRISMMLGFLSPSDFDRIDSLLTHIQYDKPLVLSNGLLTDLSQYMLLDKKNINGKIRFVLLNAIGQARASQDVFSFAVSECVIIAALKDWFNTHCS